MTKLKIKSINHGETKADKNRYCGPAVISAITGMTTGEAARLIRHVSGRKSIKGSSVWEVTRSLEMCNVDSKRESFGLALGRSPGSHVRVRQVLLPLLLGLALEQYR